MVELELPILTIGKAIETCLRNHLAFAAYRLPNTNNPVLLAQKNPEIKTIADFSEINSLKGFLVAPFCQNRNNPMFLIEPDFIFEEGNPNPAFSKIQGIKNHSLNGFELILPSEISKPEYLGQINRIIDAIKDKQFKKAVLSRVKCVSGEYGSRLPQIFELLCEFFPNAFVYIFKAGTHLWVGATPEPLATIKGNIFQTASVAGTKPFCPEYLELGKWDKKELQEQQYVTEYIGAILRHYGPENFVSDGPYIKQAGGLLHLRTDFSIGIEGLEAQTGNLLKSLHPTPAVCGMPKQKTLQFIQAIEKHNREYYSGFLGPVGFGNSIFLFVNLRCMKVYKSGLALFTGGGITIDSVPEEEWHETEIKADTLLSVIGKL